MISDGFVCDFQSRSFRLKRSKSRWTKVVGAVVQQAGKKKPSGCEGAYFRIVVYKR